MKSERGTQLACALALLGSIGGGALAPGAAWTARRVAPSSRPERIVSLALSGDEITLALAEPSRILALEEFVDDPRASNVVTEARRVSGRIAQPIVAEKILALDPDFVILPAWSDPQTSALVAYQGVPIYHLADPSSIEEVRAQIRELGSALGEAERARALIEELDLRLRAVGEHGARRTTRPSVLLAAWSGITPAGGTIFCELVELNGARCAAADAGLVGQAILPTEMLWMINPDLIVTNRFRADGNAREVVPEPALEDDPRYQGLRAVREQNVINLPTAHLLTTSHHVAALAEDLRQALDEFSRPLEDATR